MKSILLIGLGRFGRHIALKLNALNHQVMAIDHNEERVNALLPFVTNAQIGDSTNEEFLAALGVGNYDACIVAIGDNFQNSLETTYLLKELGARKIIARASKEMQEKFGLSREDASASVGFMDTIRDSLCWIAFIDSGDDEGSIRVRLRSRFMTINEIAEQFNGGGHACASGATVYSQEEMQALIAKADTAIKEYKETHEGWL